MTDSRVAVKTVPEASKGAKTSAPGGTSVTEGPRSAEELHQLVAVAAYYLAARRNFEPGHEMEDWLTAEEQIRIEANPD